MRHRNITCLKAHDIVLLVFHPIEFCKLKMFNSLNRAATGAKVFAGTFDTFRSRIKRLLSYYKASPCTLQLARNRKYILTVVDATTRAMMKRVVDESIAIYTKYTMTTRAEQSQRLILPEQFETSSAAK